jgi:hypothetical protein
MSDYKKCPKCGEYNFYDCRCEEYFVYCPDFYSEEKQSIFGTSFEAVGESIAKKVNGEEPVFEKNLFKIPIEITNKEGITKKYNCMASISIDYFAEEIK